MKKKQASVLAPEVGSSSTWDEFLEFSTTEKSFKYKNVQLVQIGQTDNDSKWNHLSGSCDNRSILKKKNIFS